MTEKNETHELEFFVDAIAFHTRDVSLTGAQIKAKAGVSEGYQLFLEEEGEIPDRAISDAETVSLQHKTKHFFAVPPATFGVHA